MRYKPLVPGFGGQVPGVEDGVGLLADPQWEKHRIHWKPSMIESVGNQFKTFAEVYAAATDALIAGFSVLILVEEAATIPNDADGLGGGDYVLPGVTFRMPIGQTVLTLSEGVAFTGGVFPNFEEGTIEFGGVTPPFVGGAFNFLNITSAIKTTAGATGPLISAPDGSTLIPVLTGDLQEVNADGYEVFAQTGTSTLLVLAGSRLKIGDDVFRGVGTSSTSAETKSTGTDISTTQTNLVNALVIDNKTEASRLIVNDANLGFTAANAQAALEAFFNGDLEYILFDDASGVPAVPLPGMMWWDATDGTLVLQTKEATVRLQVGREGHTEIMNKTGAQINNGQLVYINGADVPSDLPTVALAIADGSVEPDVTIGFATHDIGDTNAGLVTEWGLVRGLDTSGFTAGDQIYLDPTTPGAWTKTKPRYPNQVVLVGYVLKVDGSDGVVFGRIQFVKIQLQQLPIMVSDPSAFTEWVEGHYTNVATAQAISDVAPYTSTVEFANAEAIINVTAFSGALTMRIVGDSVDEATGAITAADTEDHAITATGWYRSAKKWIGTPQFQILEASSSITATINKTRYFDNSNLDFRIPAYKWQFTPSAAAWGFEYWIYRIEDDGQLTELENDAFAHTDSPVWATNGEPGTFKKGGSKPEDALTYDFIGSGQEGLIVKIDVLSIRHLNGRVAYINT